MQEWPMNVKLLKEQTRIDAEYPQEQRYSSGSIVCEGLMWEYTLPELGSRFYVMGSKLCPIFKTSSIEKILEITDKFIRFKTKNSVYKLVLE